MAQACGGRGLPSQIVTGAGRSSRGLGAAPVGRSLLIYKDIRRGAGFALGGWLHGGAMIDLNSPFGSFWSDEVLWTNMMVLLNILGALALGLIVGYERSYHGRAAGMRTYGFVCMASAALTIVAAFPQAWWGGHNVLNAPIDPT